MTDDCIVQTSAPRQRAVPQPPALDVAPPVFDDGFVGLGSLPSTCSTQRRWEHAVALAPSPRHDLYPAAATTTAPTTRQSRCFCSFRDGLVELFQGAQAP